MKLSAMAAVAAVLTVAAGAASQAAEQPVAPETTASVPVITVSNDGCIIGDYAGAHDAETIYPGGYSGEGSGPRGGDWQAETRVMPEPEIDGRPKPGRHKIEPPVCYRVTIVDDVIGGHGRPSRGGWHSASSNIEDVDLICDCVGLFSGTKG